MNNLRQKSQHLVLTDNYCPVENLLVPVVHSSAMEFSITNLLKRAAELQQKGQFAESIETYLTAIKTTPTVSIESYNEIGIMYANMDNMEQAADAFNKAIQYNEMSGQNTNIASTRYNFGSVLTKIGKQEQAMEQFRKSAEDSRRNLSKNPTYHEGWRDLGDTLATMGDLKGAAEAFKQAISLNPNEPEYYNSLLKTLEYDGQYDQAIEVMKKFIELAKNHKQDEAVLQLQEHLKYLENKNSQDKQAH